jgi:hypothetical protein
MFERGMQNIEQGILNYEVFLLQNSEFCIRYSIFFSISWIPASAGMTDKRIGPDAMNRAPTIVP